MAGDKKCMQIFVCTIIMEETAVQSKVQVGAQQGSRVGNVD